MRTSPCIRTPPGHLLLHNPPEDRAGALDMASACLDRPLGIPAQGGLHDGTMLACVVAVLRALNCGEVTVALRLVKEDLPEAQKPAAVAGRDQAHMEFAMRFTPLLGDQSSLVVFRIVAAH